MKKIIKFILIVFLLSMSSCEAVVAGFINYVAFVIVLTVGWFVISVIAVLFSKVKK
jgi:hypothetical protein